MNEVDLLGRNEIRTLSPTMCTLTRHVHWGCGRGRHGRAFTLRAKAFIKKQLPVISRYIVTFPSRSTSIGYHV